MMNRTDITKTIESMAYLDNRILTHEYHFDYN
jgi:hypothetical protein